jgi:hypothetical protein
MINHDLKWQRDLSAAIDLVILCFAILGIALWVKNRKNLKDALSCRELVSARLALTPEPGRVTARRKRSKARKEKPIPRSEKVQRISGAPDNS